MLKSNTWFGIATISHLLVDMCCACLIAILFSTKLNLLSANDRPSYLTSVALYLLLYNFCAFALQMPIGYLADHYGQKGTEGTAALGCLFIALPFCFLDKNISSVASSDTVTEAITYFSLPSSYSVTATVMIAGIGNALFHIGAGREILQQSNGKMKYAGIFVSSGALGLYLGGKVLLAHPLPIRSFCIAVLCIAALLLYSRRLLSLLLRQQQQATPEQPQKLSSQEHFPALHWCYLIILPLFVTVILRSLMGMTLSLSWTAAIPGVIPCLLLVSGKALGGILADHFGIGKTIVATLGLSTVFFLLSQNMIFGMAAILLFQTTMPVTLWLLYEQMPQNPGFAFGILTFGLFIGYVPYFFQIHTILQSTVIYAAIALLSLILLLFALYKRRQMYQP